MGGYGFNNVTKINILEKKTSSEPKPFSVTLPNKGFC